MAVETPKEAWTGTVREVTLGATADQGGTRSRTLTVGAECTLPFLHFEASIPNPLTQKVFFASCCNMVMTFVTGMATMSIPMTLPSVRLKLAVDPYLFSKAAGASLGSP